MYSRVAGVPILGLILFNIFIKEMDKETQYIWRRYKTGRLIEEMGVLPLRGTWTA